MAASNDLRGWVMSAVSGAACVLGSSVICVDLLLRRFYPRSNFQIVHNNGFLSASLCLSAGVILFTSLYSMLPTAREHLIKAGWSPTQSAYALISLFIAGVVGIRALSALLHKFLPSHVVDCAHTHGESPRHSDLERGRSAPPPLAPRNPNEFSEHTPLLTRSHKSTSAVIGLPTTHRQVDGVGPSGPEPWRVRFGRRLSGFMGGAKTHCDENGPCYGFSQACGDECSKTLDRSVISADDASETDIPAPGREPGISSSSSQTDVVDGPCLPPVEPDEQHKQPLPGSQHHHHVPQNAFLSIGLQTSVAIALHKLPEGFITYATNHASPTLGMTVFLALFIHNISEGFAMALPLYLALNSRGWAMIWSSLLGGISQPAGAGLAALWIWGARKAGSGAGDGETETSWAVYGCMFAVTAGVMTSVGLQLFTEGLVLTHQRNMAIGCAVGGMGLMGLSFALTA
ncbi:ZIP metal ion transporter [Aspergillus cavernicola]|uniref:ZIP metal ion transporter n=1 Tax=Aspergillus cavernicola TaxID=176166 RepID=A0ABR4IYI7_9EURO